MPSGWSKVLETAVPTDGCLALREAADPMHRSLDFTAEHVTLRASAAIGQNSCVGRVALRALERCAYRVVTDWRRVRVELVAEGRWVDVHPVASSQAGAPHIAR